MVEVEEKSTNESKEILSARTRSLLQYCFDSCCEQTSEDRSSLGVHLKRTKRKRIMPRSLQVMNYLRSQHYQISGGGQGRRSHCCSHLLPAASLLPRQEVRHWQGKKGPVEQSYLGRKEDVPLRGSLSSWKEPEVKKKEVGEPDNFSSADEAQSKLKEPEDNKN